MRLTFKLTLFLAFWSLSLNGYAGGKEEIIARCRTQMSDYGSVMVKACVDQDIQAANALSKYPSAAKSIIARCYNQMSDYGWMMVKACADQDIEAEKALGGY